MEHVSVPLSSPPSELRNGKSHCEATLCFQIFVLLIKMYKIIEILHKRYHLPPPCTLFFLSQIPDNIVCRLTTNPSSLSVTAKEMTYYLSSYT